MHPLAGTEKYGNAVAKVQAGFPHAGSVVEFREFVHPLIGEFLAHILLKRRHELLRLCPLCLEYQIAEQLLARILGRKSLKLLKALLRLIYAVYLQSELRQLKEQPPSHRGTFDRQKQNILCLRVLPDLFINLGDLRQETYI